MSDFTVDEYKAIALWAKMNHASYLYRLATNPNIRETTKDHLIEQCNFYTSIQHKAEEQT